MATYLQFWSHISFAVQLEDPRQILFPFFTQKGICYFRKQYTMDYNYCACLPLTLRYYVLADKQTYFEKHHYQKKKIKKKNFNTLKTKVNNLGNKFLGSTTLVHIKQSNTNKII